VYWNCPRANGRAIKVSIIIGSSQQLWSTASSGVINAIVGNTYRVECYSAAENDYVITAEIEVTAIPSNCCQNLGGLTCAETLGSLSQITASISNVTGSAGSCTGLEGSYVLTALTSGGVTYGFEYSDLVDPAFTCGTFLTISSINISLFTSSISDANPECDASFVMRCILSNGQNATAWLPLLPCSIPQTSQFLLVVALGGISGAEIFTGTLRLEP